MLAAATAMATTATASTARSASDRWFEAQFSSSNGNGYVIGRIEGEEVHGCVFVEDTAARRLDAGCDSVPLFIDPALRAAQINAEIPSQVFDLRTGRSLGSSTLKVDVWAFATGLPAAAAGHVAGVTVPELNRWTILLGGSAGFLETGASASLFRRASAYGSVTSTKTCTPPSRSLRRSSRSVRPPVPCVRAITDSASTSASLGQDLSASVG